jgi:ubiquinol-cytochrome c reductase cytochrome b subunit
MLILRRVIVGLLVVQAFTGLLLMTVYSPSTTAAWGSVWYIQTQVPCGWIIRGLHHFASDALILLLLLYATQLLVTKLYRSPHRFIWWTALVSLVLALALSLSGHLLPWDQEGYWGTKVRTNILARTPLLGELMAKLLIGGADFGNLTLTRLYTLHIAILPLALGWLIFRYPNPKRQRGVNPSLPRQADEEAVQRRPQEAALLHLPTAVAFAAAMIVILATTWYVHAVLGSVFLDAPADPTATDYPARPEWHTLFLYQGLKAFEGPILEVVGAIVIPSAIVMAFFLFPFAERIFSQRAAHRLAIGLTTVVVLSALGLTFAAKWDDRDPGDGKLNTVREKQRIGTALTKADEAVLRARQFNRQRDQAARDAKRALELAASNGIPPEGPSALLARDPLTAGPRLFATHCATCHRYDGHDGRGNVPLDPATSSDLAGFASRKWIRGLLANPMDDRYFGRMHTPDGEPAHTRMSRFISEIMPEGEEARRSLLADFDAVAAYLVAPSATSARWQQGRDVFQQICNECHSYGGERKGTTRAPEMLGYGSVEWIELMIAEPDHESCYRAVGRERARMPRFEDKLTERERNMIAVWLHDSRE